MRMTLPSTIGRKLRCVGMLVMLASGCRHVVSDPPTTPGPPIPAEPENDLGNMDTECGALITALDHYRECPNLEDGDRQWAQRTIEYAQETFAAGKKSNPDEPSQKAIAAACHRATISIDYALQRCQAGKRPKVD
jgi:hypothetical protein